MKQIIDTRVVPGEDSLSISDSTARLERELTHHCQLLTENGGVPLQHELILCSRGDVSAVELSFTVHDPSNHLANQIPSWLDPNPYGEHKLPARDSFITDWDLPPASGNDRPTDLETLREKLYQKAQDIRLLRLEPSDQEVPGNKRSCSLPEDFSHSEPATSALQMFRWLCQLDSSALFRIHLDPIVQIANTYASAEYCYHIDGVIPTDATTLEVVGYRPTIETAFYAETNHGDVTNLADYLAFYWEDLGFVPTIYRPNRPAPNQPVTETPRSPKMEFRADEHEIITDALARIKTGRGRPIPDNTSQSPKFTPVTPDSLGSLYRVPAAPTLIREGIDMLDIESTLSYIPPDARRVVLADDGYLLGADPGVIDEPLRLSETGTPATETVISDDEQTYTELLAQRTIQRDDPAGTTIVVDPTGSLSTALQARCAAQYDDRDLFTWDVAAHPPAVTPLDSERLCDAGWDHDDAATFVADTHDQLLQASACEYTVSRPPDTVDIPSTPALQPQYHAAFDQVAPSNYTSVVTCLDDDRVRRSLSHYITPRLNTTVSPETADRAYEYAVDLYESLKPFRTEKTTTDLLTDSPNAIIYLDTSGFETAANRRLATVLLLRDLATSLACHDDTTLPPVTVTLPGLSLFTTTDFLTPLVDHARNHYRLSLDLIFGIHCNPDGSGIPHPDLTHACPFYTIATGEEFTNQLPVDRLKNRLPAWAPNITSINQQAKNDAFGAIYLDEEPLVSSTEPFSCCVRLPHEYSSRSDESNRPRSETDTATSEGIADPLVSLLAASPELPKTSSEISDTATEAVEDDPATQSSSQAALTATPTLADEDARSDVQLSDGVIKKYDGPACETCGRVYDVAAEAVVCHNPSMLSDTQTSETLASSQTHPDIAYSQQQLSRFDSLMSSESDIVTAVKVVSGSYSLDDAVTRLQNRVKNIPSFLDPWAMTFLITIELARLGYLPGYSLYQSMTKIRDTCLFQSACTIDYLESPPSDAAIDEPLITTHKLQGNIYYELSPFATQHRSIPHARQTSYPVFGTPLYYNLGVVTGSYYIATTHPVNWIQAPHTLSATGIDAFAGFTAENSLSVLGTVIHKDPYQAEQADSLQTYITEQYMRASRVSADAVWVTRNSTVARGVLDVLADNDHIDLPRSVYDSVYKISDLQSRFVADLRADGLEEIHSLTQLLETGDDNARIHTQR